VGGKRGSKWRRKAEGKGKKVVVLAHYLENSTTTATL
jgi:hypothetical protein